ncbi:MAG: hypothetical protein E5X74_02895 [Mesorhizobium sp.]|uniref:hypothetical protein n=1 Tax=Mesorhizobium sp. TaxID=1871066 RepID=UPI00121E9562|nr:hypothetical protein [Mesorhizobium sp.]TIO78385.1 MAG: hypothetical protein E5X75_04350 [Mesorhizobium sp.]TIO87966.1 MAG: hypothetical protein E5X74_02895 [Mesorhizobium sp.]
MTWLAATPMQQPSARSCSLRCTTTRSCRHSKAFDAELLNEKNLVDCPPDFENRFGSNGSLAEDIANAVPTTRVVKAFNSIYAEVIDRVEQPVGREPVTLFVAATIREPRRLSQKSVKRSAMPPSMLEICARRATSRTLRLLKST